MKSIIKDGDFSKLIGKSESEFFDCKREIYDIKKDTSKYELAKDVSAFANARGGLSKFVRKTCEPEKPELQQIDPNRIKLETGK